MRATPAELFDFEGCVVEKTTPGAFQLDKPAPGYLLLACPGCGRVAAMRVGDPKPPNHDRATWRLTGPPDAITLWPSVNCEGCCGWHGWLRDGVFTPC